MSRIARVPVEVAKGVDIQIADDRITVKGPLGTLTQAMTARVAIAVADGQITFAAADESREAKAMSGTMRALVAGNGDGRVEGASKSAWRWSGRLSSAGPGRQAQPVARLLAPGGARDAGRREVRNADADGDRHQGADKQKVGQVAAEVRGYKPPEPYKAKACGMSARRSSSKRPRRSSGTRHRP